VVEPTRLKIRQNDSNFPNLSGRFFFSKNGVATSIVQNVMEGNFHLPFEAAALTSAFFLQL